MGAAHGDEPESAWLMAEMRRVWLAEFSFRNVGVLLWEQVNPDGLALGQRGNGRGVDLNRNLPTQDWSADARAPRYFPGMTPSSEPESQALIRLIQVCRPCAILSAHSFTRYQINSNGPARPWSEHISAISGYPVTEDIGYPTPGCFGTYAGRELQIPTITLEIENGLSREKVLQIHVPAMQGAAEYWEKLNPAV